MDKERNEVTIRILSFTLEIIYLLTGEDYIIVKKTSGDGTTPNSHLHESGGWSRSQSPITEAPPHLLIHEQRILELTNKITELLPGEVPIRCQDVAVYFSMEEWEYVEGHKDLYKDVMMENHPLFTSEVLLLNNSKMDKEGNVVPIRILNFTLEIIYLLTGEDYLMVKTSGDCTTPNSHLHESGGRSRSQSPITEAPPHLPIHEQKILEFTNKITELLTGEVPIRCQDVAVYFSMEEWEYLGRHKNLYKDVMMEKHQPLISQENPSESFDGNFISSLNYKVEDKDIGQHSSEEKLITFHTDLAYNPNKNADGNFKSSLNSKTEDTMYHSKGENAIILIVYPGFKSTDLSCDPPNHKEPSPNQSQNFTTSTGQKMLVECGKRLTNSSGLYIRKIIHTEDKLHSCSECGKCFPYKAGLLRHERAHTGEKPYSCSECGKCFTNKSDLIRHNRTHTGEKPYSCSECGKGFKNKSLLIRHYKIHTGEKPHLCSECGKSFVGRADLARHMRSHTGEKPFLCPECGKGFTDKSNLSRHVRIHTGDKPYSCLECEKGFKDKSDLLKHHRIHIGEKPFPCSECGKCFMMKSNLIKHQRIHTGVKPFSCSECGKCFTTNGKRKDHQRRHSGEKPFSCSECEKCFILKTDLVKHQKIHTGEKPYSCSECGKCFMIKSELVIHETLHTGEKPFSCSECGKCFMRKSNLVRHKKLHTGEKLFSCSECGKCFTTNCKRRDHQRLHTGENPFSCSECGKGFMQKSNLVRHQRCHSGKKLI
ncbi:zinc finger protein 345-like isoform X1 [Eleutherodactylus coqui]|uniref:zinc finger protein 345-like isoform X1 n=1 Tax=Eleutherodactylus coqui TaxID=57060 RepID=UPI0034626CB2